ncbi:hypothetical protein T03_7976 [Trichinella britovi]|uniref:Uncharacterized protein n=1 Tax=Trichinella britovi TaxID=45882 RepID=A0A0V1CCY5_TRIBR|nr:hypothetical protein T03_7976 [Trichinella britovi]
MLIKNHHVRQMHASDNQTLVAIRTRYCLVKARNTAKKVDAKPYQLKMGDSKLKMANRVTESAPFNQTERTNTVNPGDHLLDDSRVALAWIKEASARWKPFVANRCWRYYPTKENPADIPSRGCPPGTLINTALWWHGPPCLMQSRENWPTEPVAKVDDNKHLTAEQKTVKVLAGQIDGYSVTAYCLRFARNCQSPLSERTNHINLLVKELSDAEARWLRRV